MRLAHLTVHGIGTPLRRLEDGEERTWITVDQFVALLDAVEGRPHVRLTFDDANSSDVEIALPRLTERGMSATFFVLAGLLGEPGRLDRDDVRELQGAGMRIGSHGWAHRSWRSVCAASSAPGLAHEELVLAPRALARLTGQEVSEVAVPFGEYDRLVLSRLRSAGATRVYTSDTGWARSGTWLQPRSSIHADSDLTWGDQVTRRPPAFTRRLRAGAARNVKRLRGSAGASR